MSNSTAHWLETALNEPYKRHNLAYLRRKFNFGLMICGALSMAIVVVYALIALYRSPQPRPTVRVTMLDTPYGLRLNEPSASGQPSSSQLPMPSSAIHATTSTTSARPPTPAATHSMVDARSARQVLEVRLAAPTVPQPQPPAKDPLRALASQPTLPLPTPAKQSAEISTPSLPLRGSEKKPLDVASSEKTGIQKIAYDSITLVNGLRVPIGNTLPNGEKLLAVDAQKGMVETDRRVIVVTP